VDVDAYMAERTPQVDAGIEARIPADAEIPAGLRDAMRHLLFPGGKRLRPSFALAAAEAVRGAPESALPIAIAVELVHTYSLIHDDLPCMDDDDERRGRPTVHVAYDEATAVLAGDALLTEAFSVLAEAAVAAEDGRPAVEVIRRLAEAAGARGLVGGQADDLDLEANPLARGTDHERLASIHTRKTAALFRAAIVGGAALGGGDARQCAVLDEFAREVGIAFQIADDLLDGDSGEAASILRLGGAEGAGRDAEALLDRALARIEGWGEPAEPLRSLARFAVRRNR